MHDGQGSHVHLRVGLWDGWIQPPTMAQSAWPQRPRVRVMAVPLVLTTRPKVSLSDGAGRAYIIGRDSSGSPRGLGTLGRYGRALSVRCRPRPGLGVGHIARMDQRESEESLEESLKSKLTKLASLRPSRLTGRYYGFTAVIPCSILVYYITVLTAVPRQHRLFGAHITLSNLFGGSKTMIM